MLYVATRYTLFELLIDLPFSVNKNFVIQFYFSNTTVDVISDLEDKIDELSQFYSDPLNWHSFDSKCDLKRDIMVLPNAAISGLTEAIINNYSNEFFTSRQFFAFCDFSLVCDNASATKQHIMDCTKSLEGIQQSALKRIGQRRLPEIKRNISFGECAQFRLLNCELRAYFFTILPFIRPPSVLD